MINTYIIIALTIISMVLFFKYFNLRFVGSWSNPFGLFFSLNIFLVSLPGIVLVYSDHITTFLNEGIFSVSAETINYVTLSYFFSILIIMFSIMLLSILVGGFNVNESIRSSAFQETVLTKFIRASIILNLIFLILLFLKIGIGNIPILENLRGNVENAQILKAKLISGEISKLPESINQIFRILIPFNSYLIAFKNFSTQSIRKLNVSFLISFITALIYFTYDLQKAPFFTYIFGLLFISMFHRGVNLKFFLIIPIMILAFLGINALYFGLTSPEDFSILLEKVVVRLFVMQNQGFYYIVEHITPSYEYLKNGAIFSSYIFSDLPQPADSTVMEIMYGYSESNVNMNSYFLAQAYSIGGASGIALGSFVIAIHLCLYLLVFKKLYIRNIGFFMPLSIVFYLFFIPINQGFNTFLYGRNLIFFTVFATIIYLSYLIIYKSSKSNLNILRQNEL